MDEETDFSEQMVQKIVKYVSENKEVLIEQWVEYHGKAKD
jgi:hypothetical protein